MKLINLLQKIIQIGIFYINFSLTSSSSNVINFSLSFPFFCRDALTIACQQFNEIITTIDEQAGEIINEFQLNQLKNNLIITDQKQVYFFLSFFFKKFRYPSKEKKSK